MTNAKRLFRNTVSLTVVNILLRGISVSFNVYLTGRVGSAGIGLFQLIMTVYSMAITFSSSGIRLASTRLVADSNDAYSDREIMARCFSYALFFGIVVQSILFFGSGWASDSWIHDVRAERSLRILSGGLPFIALSSALGGYFTAVRRVVKYAGVQLVEQLFCIGATVLLIHRYAPLGLEWACFAMSLGICLSEFVSFLCSFILYKFEIRNTKNKNNTTGLWKRLLHIALPDAVGSWMRSILLTVEHLLIPVGFRKSGLNSEGAMATYGVLHGMVLPVLLFPSAILNALAGLLIPEISSLNAKGRKEQIKPFMEQILRMTAMFAVITAAVFYAFGDRFSSVLYHTNDAKAFFQILSPLVLFMYLDMTVDGMLKGLDQQLYSMRYNILDSSLCVILVWALIPKYAVRGYIITLYASEVMNFFLSFQRLIKVGEVRLNLFRSVAKPIFCAVVSVVLFCKIPIENTIVGLVCAVGGSVTIYAVLLYFLQCFDRDDIKWALKVIK